MDSTTFGSFPAARTLIDILNKDENIKLASKVCSYIADFKETLDGLKDIKDSKIRNKMSHLWKEECERVIKGTSLPDDVKSYTLNVEATFFKMFRKADKC
jgi:hypothetical protein